MKRFYFILMISIVSVAVPAFPQQSWKEKSANPDYIHRAIKEVTDVIVHDIYSPPVASRTYAYITIAGYEASVGSDPNYISLSGQLHNLAPFPPPPSDKRYSAVLASVQAILLVAKTMVISDEKISDFQQKILKEFKDLKMPEEIFQASLRYGKQVADHILSWASKDNYKLTRSMPKYFVTEEEASWKPTPPAYLKAVEPHWNKIRTFVIDSAQQFKPLPATIFSTNKNDAFYKEAQAVYLAGLHLSAEQRNIASFWDCNPFKMNINGHVMYATKKISPGGHWINITRTACKKSKADCLKTLEAYACVSVVLADAFISCWDEKYRSNVIRPETYINEHIDSSWAPILQTPPFPEYTSGHSVISATCAVMLTQLFGDNFFYTDSTEVEFGLPVRKYKSFKMAAEEAAISRFYGGIHYMPSIRNGMDEGYKIAGFIIQRLKTRRTG